MKDSDGDERSNETRDLIGCSATKLVSIQLKVNNVDPGTP